MGQVEIQLPLGCLREDAECTATEKISREGIPVKCAEDMGPVGKCAAAAVVRFKNSTSSDVTRAAPENSCLKAITSKKKDAPQPNPSQEQGGGGKKKKKGGWW